MSEPVYVVSLGASTPMGRDALSSAAAVRAGISGFVEHPSIVDSTGEPVRVAMAPWLDLDCQGPTRFEALLMPAIEQALGPLKAADNSDLKIAMALGLPSRRPGLPLHLSDVIQASIAKRYGKLFTAQAVLKNGHAAALVGLHAALKRMAEGAFDVCLLAGVESYLATESLAWLEDNDQLHGAGSLNNAWGFVPGEAAGAVLLVAERVVAQCGIEPLGRVLGVGRAFERNQIKTQTVCIGEGLTECFREALTGLPSGASVTDVYCDMNGEPYRADEFGFATLRTKQHFQSASDFVAPADCWGDVSAASAPLGLMLAAMASRTGYARGPLAFLWASSETGERGAALVAFPSHGAA